MRMKRRRAHTAIYQKGTGLEKRNRQTDRRTDGSQHCFMPLYCKAGGGQGERGVTSMLAMSGSSRLTSVSDERRLAASRRAIVGRLTSPTPALNRLSSSVDSPPVNSARINRGTSLFMYVYTPTTTINRI